MESQSPKVTFTVSLEEANIIFKSLGALPFSQVYELIGKLNQQANLQLRNNASRDDQDPLAGLMKD